MLFRRRKKLGFLEKIQASFWPKMGWFRAFSYFQLRIVRLPGSAGAIAAGFAAGGAVSMTPFIGLHTLMGLGVAWVVRGNYVAAAIGTLIGNPWTFPFIWILTYRIGALMIGLETDVVLADIISPSHLVANPLKALSPVLLPMTLGSLPVAILVYFVIYWPTCRFIEGHKRRRQGRLLQKQKSGYKEAAGERRPKG